MLRAELCSILSSATSHLSQSLMHHQQALSRSLEQHVKEEDTTVKSGSS